MITKNNLRVWNRFKNDEIARQPVCVHLCCHNSVDEWYIRKIKSSNNHFPVSMLRDEAFFKMWFTLMKWLDLIPLSLHSFVVKVIKYDRC